MVDDNDYKRHQLSIFHENFSTDAWPTIESVKDGLIDVDGPCNLKNGRTFSRLPINFGIIKGALEIINAGLTSLDGMPSSVFNLWLIGNSFKTLEGLPVARYSIRLDYNQIQSLKGIQSLVNGDCNVSCNDLTDLVGGPKTVDGDYYVYDNPLTSLVGIPEIIFGMFQLTMDSNLALLRVISCDIKTVEVFDSSGHLLPLTNVIENYLPDEHNRLPLKQRLWGFQQDLVRLGFENNAKW
jgi:hypothetical protein